MKAYSVYKNGVPLPEHEVVISEDGTRIFGGLIRTAGELWRAVLSMKGAQE